MYGKYDEQVIENTKKKKNFPATSVTMAGQFRKTTYHNIGIIIISHSSRYMYPQLTNTQNIDKIQHTCMYSYTTVANIHTVQ